MPSRYIEYFGILRGTDDVNHESFMGEDVAYMLDKSNSCSRKFDAEIWDMSISCKKEPWSFLGREIATGEKDLDSGSNEAPFQVLDAVRFRGTMLGSHGLHVFMGRGFSSSSPLYQFSISVSRPFSSSSLLYQSSVDASSSLSGSSVSCSVFEPLVPPRDAISSFLSRSVQAAIRCSAPGSLVLLGGVCSSSLSISLGKSMRCSRSGSFVLSKDVSSSALSIFLGISMCCSVSGSSGSSE
mmetsp:Transcript_31484/g.66681  ORF Transcript_31484/g.66681 Transcript_31484/m.66681 type:complete len:240 (-) Transcript_31484:368-1087(-)